MLGNSIFKKYTGESLVLISALMFGSYGIFSRLLANFDIFYQTFVRCFIITLIFILYGLYKGQFKKIEPSDYKWFLSILTITNFTIAPIVYAFQKLEIGTASFLFYASFTIFTYILGVIFFREKMTTVKLFSLSLAFVGLLLIFRIKFELALLFPILMAILNGFASGFEVTLSKKISHKYSNTQINALVFGSIAVTHLFISFVLGETMDAQLVTTALPVLLIFVAAAIIGMVTVIAGFKYVEPSTGALIGLMEIVFAVIFGYIFFSESLGASTILGGSLIILASVIPNFQQLFTFYKK